MGSQIELSLTFAVLNATIKMETGQSKKSSTISQIENSKTFYIKQNTLDIMYCKIFGFVDSHLSMSYLTFAILYQINAADDLLLQGIVNYIT